VTNSFDFHDRSCSRSSVVGHAHKVEHLLKAKHPTEKGILEKLPPLPLSINITFVNYNGRTESHNSFVGYSVSSSRPIGIAYSSLYGEAARKRAETVYVLPCIDAYYEPSINNSHLESKIYEQRLLSCLDKRQMVMVNKSTPLLLSSLRIDPTEDRMLSTTLK